jgi:hypothetical protein
LEKRIYLYEKIPFIIHFVLFDLFCYKRFMGCEFLLFSPCIESLKIELTLSVKSPLTPLFQRGEIPPFSKGGEEGFI